MKCKKLLAALLCALLTLLPLAGVATAAALPQKGAALGGLDGLSDMFSGLDLGGLFSGGLLSEEQRSQFSDLLSGLFAEGADRADISELIAKIREILSSNGQNSDNGSIAQILAGLMSNPNFSIQDILSGKVDLGSVIGSLMGGQTTTEESTTAPVVTEPATEPTTQAPVTIPTTTEIPTTIVYIYQGSQQYAVPTTQPTTEAVYTYEYIEPDTVTVPVLTTQDVYQPVSVEEYTEAPVKEKSFSVKTAVGVALLVLSLAAVIVVAVILKKSKV